MSSYFLEGDFLKGAGYEGGKRFMKTPEPPTAIFAANDYMALGAYDAILDEGFRIPQDVALVGFNDIEFTAMKGIEMTTIGQKKYEMGAIAVRSLIERVEGGKAGSSKEIILEPELIVRKTCGFQLKGYQRPGLERKIDLPLMSPSVPYGETHQKTERGGTLWEEIRSR
jgi:LacI family transcriptional regulator